MTQQPSPSSLVQAFLGPLDGALIDSARALSDGTIHVGILRESWACPDSQGLAKYYWRIATKSETPSRSAVYRIDRKTGKVSFVKMQDY